MRNNNNNNKGHATHQLRLAILQQGINQALIQAL
jgi:hypothetical protein